MMNVAIVLATAVLLIQGTKIVIRPAAQPFVRCFGALTLLLAALSFVLFAMLYWGAAVLSPEFDVVMVRGNARGLVVLLVGFAVAAGLGLHVQRLKFRLPGRLAGLLFLGLAVGAVAATRISRLVGDPGGEDTALAFRIYSYDLWWPPLLIWVSACFVDGAITVLGVRDRRVRTGALLVMIIALSRLAQRREFTDPSSERLWALAFQLAVAGGVLFVAWSAWRARLGPGDAWRLLATALDRSQAAIRRHGRRAVSGGWPRILGHAWRWTKPRAGQLLAVLALATIAGCLADIFYVGRLPQAGALVMLAIAWTCLAEATAQGPFRAFIVNVVPEVFGKLAHQKSWIRQGWLLLRGQLAGPASRLGTALRHLMSLRPFPEALMKLAVLFIALVVAYEIPHRSKTLLQPFSALVVNVKDDKVGVPTVSAQADIGHAVFHHLVNTLGALTADLEPDVILLLPPDPERGARFRTLAPGGVGSIDPFLTQGIDIDLGSIKLPLGFLLTPVLQPVRWLLAVRVVNGSVLADPDGYTVLVQSSTGEMWRARLDHRDASRANSAGEPTVPGRFVPDQSFNRLALELAFRIMSAEPALVSSGMTRSWDAFEEFRDGLFSWREFMLHRGAGDPDALSSAIRHFRAAASMDPAFALAHYRLGIALQHEGQRLAAAEALRASLKANPGFVPAVVALASVLYSLEEDQGVPVFGLPRLATDQTAEAKVQEARRLWQSVLTAPRQVSSLDRAAAWAGLCRHALDEPDRRGVAATDGQPHWVSASYRIAYFHCQQAERLYAGLLATPSDDLRVKTARAAELASLGMLLERHGPHRIVDSTDKWQCTRTSIDEDALAAHPLRPVHRIRMSHYTGAALRYYRRAVQLLPNDSVLRCHEAAAARAKSSDRAPMGALEAEAASRLHLAESYRHEARRHLADLMRGHAGHAADPERSRRAALAAAYFGLALSEHAESQRRDPTNLEALNRYAQVFWEWRQGEASKHLTAGPGLVHARRAESNARMAIAVVDSKRGKPGGNGHAGTSRGPAASPDGAGQIDRVGALVPAPDVPVARSAMREDAMSRHLRAASATAHASLGAVLVAQTRPHEAIEVLEVADGYTSRHPAFDHVRWMLAQAHLCAAAQQFRAMRAEQDRDGQGGSNPPRTPGRPAAALRQPSGDAARPPSAIDDPRMDAIGAHRERARGPLGIVRDHERARESPAFPGLTDISRSDRICQSDWLATLAEREAPAQFEVKQIASTNYRKLCRWIGVRPVPPDGWTDTDDEPVFLHLWGGGMEERVALRGRALAEGSGGKARRHDPIPLTPTRKPFYYFAQLENAAQTPVSRPVVLTGTYPETDGVSPGSASAAGDAVPPGTDLRRLGSERRCDGKNLIQLKIGPIGSAAAQAAREG